MSVPLNMSDFADNIYAQLIESLDCIVWEADADTMVMTYVSPAAERLLGYPLADWLEPGFWINHVHPEDQSWVASYCQSETQAGRSHDFEYRMLRKDGQVIWLRDIVTLVLVDGTRKLRGLMVDVTERKRNDTERQERVRLLECMDQIAKVIEGANDPEDLIQNVLLVLLEIFHCERAWLVAACEPTANTWRSIRECVRQGCTNAFRTGKTFSLDEENTEFLKHVLSFDQPQVFGSSSNPLPRIFCDSHRVQTQVCMALHPRKGSPCILGIHYCEKGQVLHQTELDLFKQIGLRVSDALTSLHISQELRDSELRFRTFFNHVVDAILIHDIDGCVIDANDQACKNLGYSREELIGTYPDFFDNSFNEVDRRRFRERLERDELLHFVSQHHKKDASVFPVEVWVKRFMLRDQELVISLARDLSERTLLEEQFHQSQKMEAIGRLAGGMAHDFNNLLTVIGGYSELILSSSSLDSRDRGYIEEIKKANVRASNLTQQLLTFSRRKLIRPQIVDVNQRIAELRTLLHRLIREDILLDIAADAESAFAKIDPGQFEHAIINLVVNAQDAMPSGGQITIRTSNYASIETNRIQQHSDPDSDGLLEIMVSDNGTGIEEGIRDRIFEPFFTTKPQGKGTGLGLAMVYGFVQQSHGSVKVESSVGQGTSIRMLLPSVARVAVIPSTSSFQTKDTRGMETILLVEDEPHVRELAQLTLKEQGYKVLVATDGIDGIEVAQNYPDPIDLLISDLVMPRMSGGNLAEKLRAVRPQLKVLFISGYIDQETPRLPSWIDFSYCQKPFTPRILLDKVRECLSRHASTQ